MGWLQHNGPVAGASIFSTSKFLKEVSPCCLDGSMQQPVEDDGPHGTHLALAFFSYRRGGQAISSGEICVGMVTVKDEIERWRREHKSARSAGKGFAASMGPTASHSATIV